MWLIEWWVGGRSLLGPPHKITTVDGGELEADNVVVATHLPFLDRTGHFTVAEPSRSYAIAASLTDDTKMINGRRSLLISSLLFGSLWREHITITNLLLCHSY